MMHAALPVLLEAVLRALLAACALGLCLRLLRVKNVPAQKAAWGLALLAALAMPLLMRMPWLPAWAEVKLPEPSWLSRFDAAPAMKAAPMMSVSAPALPVAAQRYPDPVISESQFDAPEDDLPVSAPAQITRATTVPEKAAAVPTSAGIEQRTPDSVPAPARFSWFTIVWALYLGVAAALLLRMLLGLVSSIRIWFKAAPVETAEDSAVAVRWSRSVASPVNIGSGILLPADYRHWDEEKLRVVLAHERSHVQQRDFYLQLLAGLYAALTWFSPLGWWLKRKLSELGEAISDHAGLEVSASPSAYAELLLEFAALPHHPLTGVAMASSSRLAQRIEQVLNDENFRQAFAGRRRALAAVVVAPVALMAATALVHVQAAERTAQPALMAQAAAAQTAGQATSDTVDQAQEPITGQSHPADPQVTDEGTNHPSDQGSGQGAGAGSGLGSGQTPPAAPSPEPSAAPAPSAPPAQPMPAPDAAPPMPPVPPIHVEVEVPPMPPIPPMTEMIAQDVAESMRHLHDFNGEPYAIVGDPGTKSHFVGNWDYAPEAEIDKARKVAHGHFLWFQHDGKAYIVDDPTIVSQIEAMRKPMDDLRDQMHALGKQMRDAGQQEREKARQAREQAAAIPTPDLSKEMADLDAAVANLKSAQGSTMTREQLREIERKLEEVQRKLMTAQVKVDVSWSRDMGEFGRQQGELGAKMGQLGAQMGHMARENDQKVRSIIDQSLKDGKARPVE